MIVVFVFAKCVGTMILTPKVDVYCFGVLILELIHSEYLDDMVSSCKKKESNWSFDFSEKTKKEIFIC